ncbi:TPA: DUF551 domain-containing protein [Klebsiella pneumoniae]
MTKSTITRERLEELSAGQSGFNLRIATHEESQELARIVLAAMGSEPVAWWTGPEPTPTGEIESIHDHETGSHSIPLYPLYRHAQPAPVGNEFIPKNLDRALGVLGMALPESKEEFNLQSERWIQRLIDRVIRYADEFKAQPAPVVNGEYGDAYQGAREDLAIWKRRALEAEESVRRLEQINDHLVKEAQGESRMGEPVIAQPAPVVPDGYVMVPKEPTEDMIAAAMNCDDVLFNGDDSFCVQFWNIYEAMLAAANCSIPMISERWIPVSERMPELDTRVLLYFSNYGGHIEDGCIGDDGDGPYHYLFDGDSLQYEPTHWMPLPAPPKEVK